MHLFRSKEDRLTMPTPLSAIGYIRVSTEMQNQEDQALKRQAEKIRQHCADRGIKLLSLYDDTCSAVDAYSVERRPALADSIRWAAEVDACLMVPEPTRLFRNVAVASRWLKSINVPVYSVQDARILSHQELLEAVRAGQQVAKATSDGTVKGLQMKRASGAKLGSKADHTVANKASAKARKQRSDAIVDTIAHILLENEAYRDLSNRALADLLNRRKILTGWQRPWTGVGLKRHRKKAEERIEEWAELEQDDLPVAPPPQVAQSNAAPAVDVAAATTGEDAIDEDERQMRALSTYGMF